MLERLLRLRAAAPGIFTEQGKFRARRLDIEIVVVLNRSPWTSKGTSVAIDIDITSIAIDIDNDYIESKTMLKSIGKPLL